MVYCIPARDTHITRHMCMGIHISRGYTYHCDTDARRCSYFELGLSVVLTASAEVKYSSRKITLKTARDGEKNMTHDSVNIFLKGLLKICFKFCILEQIIATVLFICISSINNKRSLLRFQSTTAPTNRGWSACDCTVFV